MSFLPTTGKLKWQGEEHSWARRHGLSLVLWAIFIIQTIICVVAYWYVWKNGWDKKAKDWGADIFAVFFLAVYMTSIVADTYGALIQVVLTKWFYEEGSATAKDPEDEGS